MDRVAWLLEGLASGGPAVASSILFLGFGAAAAWLFGLRSLLLLVVAALPTGIGLLVLTAHVLGSLGLHTTLVMDAVVALAVAAVVAAAVQRLRMRGAPAAPPAAAPPDPLVWAGAAIGALIALGVWLAGIGNFGLPPQANDDIWHGYLVERLTHLPAITAGDVAPLYVDGARPVMYYPYGLHLSGALIHEVAGVGVAEVLNGAWVVSVGMLLSFGLAALAWRLFPDRPWVAFWSGALSAGVTAFPYLTNGILPYTVALAMVPGTLALLLAFLDERPRVPSMVLALAAVGVFVTHPAGALVAAVLGALVVIEQMLRTSSLRDARRIALRLGLVGTFAAIASLPWVLAVGTGGPGAPATSAAVGGLVPAIWMVLGLASPWTPPQPVLAALVVVGVLTSVVSRRAIGITAGLLIFAALFVGVVAGVKGIVDLTGPWYGNWYRLLAVVGLLVPVLAGLGVASAVGVSRGFAARIAPRATWALPAIAVVIGSFVAVRTAYDVAAGQSIMRTTWHSPQLVTAGDVQLLRDLADRLESTDKVLNSPRDGSTWMYAMFGSTPIFPYPYGEIVALADPFTGTGAQGDAGAACQVLERAAATYAVVKDVRGDINDQDYDIGGFVSQNPGLFIEVVRTDTGRAYRIDQGSLERCAGG